MRSAWIGCSLVVIVAGCRGRTDAGGAEVEALRQRVAALERQVAEVSEGDRGDAAEIRAAGFVLVGPDKKVKARLGFDRLGKLDAVPGLYVYDKNGTKRVAIVETGWAGGIACYDPRGAPRVAIAETIVVRTDNADVNIVPRSKGKDYWTRLVGPEGPAPAEWFGDRPPAN